MRRILYVCMTVVLLYGIYRYAEKIGDYSALGAEPCAEEVSISEEESPLIEGEAGFPEATIPYEEFEIEIPIEPKAEDGYELTLYSNSNEEILSMVFPKEPVVTSVEENLLEISISVGSPAAYIFFVDTETEQVSETFFNPIYLGNRCVAYWENDGLALTDIFQEGLFYREIRRDFSKCADPISAIIAVELLDNGDILLDYYEGENHTEKSEIVTYTAPEGDETYSPEVSYVQEGTRYQ